MKCPHTIFQKEESSGEINKNYLKKSLTSLISTCYNAIRTLLNSAFLCVQKGAFEKKDHQLNLFAKNAKSLKEKEASELSVKIQNTNRDRVNYSLF
mgnify:CR=1 FL=1